MASLNKKCTWLCNKSNWHTIRTLWICSNKVLISLYTYHINFKCMLIELLQTGLTAYTQQECTYSAQLLYQPSYKQKCTIQECYKQYETVQTAKWGSWSVMDSATTSSGSELLWVSEIQWNKSDNLLKSTKLSIVDDAEFIPQIFSHIWIANKLNCFSNFLLYRGRTNSW